MKPTHALLMLFATLTACGPQAPSEEPKQDAAPTAEPTAESPAPSVSATPAAPKKPTKAELESEMAPPDKVLDVRPLLGTDPEQPMPAIFAKVKKGMTAKDLDAEFPGVGAVKTKFVTFTRQAKKWVKAGKNFPESQIHEVLDIAYDDQGGLVRIGYIFDPKAASDAFWTYLKKAAQARFGKADGEGDRMVLPCPAVKVLAIQKTDAKTYSLDLEL